MNIFGAFFFVREMEFLGRNFWGFWLGVFGDFGIGSFCVFWLGVFGVFGLSLLNLDK